MAPRYMSQRAVRQEQYITDQWKRIEHLEQVIKDLQKKLELRQAELVQVMMRAADDLDGVAPEQTPVGRAVKDVADELRSSVALITDRGLSRKGRRWSIE